MLNFLCMFTISKSATSQIFRLKILEMSPRDFTEKHVCHYAGDISFLCFH